MYDLIGAEIQAPTTHILYDLCNIKKLKSSNLTQIDAKTLVMDLTSIFNLIPNLRDEKNDKYKNHYQPRKKHI